MSDENTDPTSPAPRKRARKSKSVESSQTASNDVAAESGNPLPETRLYVPESSENAIGTSLGEGQQDESAGGDPNSPADSALSAALRREESLASHVVNAATHIGGAHSDATSDLGQEYPGERDPSETPSETQAAETASSESAEEPELPPDEPTDPNELERIVEALLFAALEPITVREIARAADSDSATIRKVLKALKETGDRERRPWDLVEIANAYRLVTRSEFHSAIQRLKTQTSQRKLTQAALETLALIAYRQPIGRAEIESIRGVNAGPVLRLLLEKKLVQISGRGTGLGQPLLYGTTDYFLENFGLKNITELPKPGEFKNA
ncbi:MAG: SMC-Scp complex subunit ScpB [Planctomycetota bacterium]